MFWMPPNTKELILYKNPVSMQWGHERLLRLCREEMGLDPREGGVFLFFNKAQDCMKVFFVDDSGDQSITKKLDRGGFLMPVSNDDSSFVKVRAGLLPTLFKSK